MKVPDVNEWKEEVKKKKEVNCDGNVDNLCIVHWSSQLTIFISQFFTRPHRTINEKKTGKWKW